MKECGSVPFRSWGEGRDDLDEVEHDPHKQKGATEAVQQAIYGPRHVGLGHSFIQLGRSSSERGNWKGGDSQSESNLGLP